MSPPAEEEESVKLRGREVAVGRRIVVWYEQDGAKVEYFGTVTRVGKARGARVWFDGHSFLEQEWVNHEDEWRFEDDPMLPAAADVAERARRPDPADEEDACEFQQVKLKLGKLSQLLPKAGKQAKRKRGADAAGAADVDAAEAAAAAVTAAAARAAAAARGPRTVYQLTAAGVFASENGEAAAGGTNLPHLKAPRRAPPSLLAKYGRCELSGRVAIYRDPLTGARFGTAEAFRGLRARHADGQGGAATKPAGTAAGRGARGGGR